MDKTIRSLTEEEKQKVIFVIDDFFNKEIPDVPAEYTDLYMVENTEEFKSYLMEDTEPEQIEALMEILDDYINNRDLKNSGSIASSLSLCVMYDMWVNKSAVWPV